jgi:hypothetical protein
VALRAQLVARGHQVVDLADLGALAAFRPERSRHGAVRLVVVDENLLRGAAEGVLDEARRRFLGAPLVLLQSWLGGATRGPWDAVISRAEPGIEILERLASPAATPA